LEQKRTVVDGVGVEPAGSPVLAHRVPAEPAPRARRWRACARPHRAGLDFDRVLRDFAAFWVAHGEVLAGRMPYHEVAPQLVLMAFLQRVVNGGGHIDREYGVGRGRIDLLVRWPLRGPTRDDQRFALELKVRAEGRSDPLSDGLTQLDAYLDRLALDTGVLVIFDRRPDAAPIHTRTRFESATSPTGRAITVLRA